MSITAMQRTTDFDGCETAGELYLELIGPVNQVVAMFNAASDDSGKGRAIQALAIVLDLVSAEIETISWPTAAEDAVNQFLAATSAAGAAAGSLIEELTDEAAAIFAAEVDTLSSASTDMRAALGLPMPGGPFPIWR
jgi:hypothetical protein